MFVTLLKTIQIQQNKHQRSTSLQRQVAKIQRLEKIYNVKIINDHNIDLYNDLDSQMALINNCDLVLTISNVTAHLAGSAGKKTILMLAKYIGDIYYWALVDKKNNSTIYPSINIIKQTCPDDWNQVLINAKDQIINI